MPANKAQLAIILAAKSGLTQPQTEAALNALPEAIGQWLLDHGADAPGVFNGEVDANLSVGLSRTPTPTPRWILKLEPLAAFLDDFGNGSARFGLPVVND